MLDATLARLNRWALKNVGREWLDYIASNTMTNFNRRWNDFVWTYDLKALVVAVKDEARDVKTVTLMPNQLWRHMEPGQHIAVSATVGGEVITRHYSLAPMEDDCLSISVKRVPGGRMSGWIHEQLKPGMVLDIGQAQGHFCYRQQNKLLFISAGSGITPCHSMAKALHGYPLRPDIAFYAQFLTGRDVIFADALRRWRTEGMAVTTAVSHPEASDAGKFAPALTAENIETLWPDFRERDIYLCGPQGFMDQIVEILKAKGYDLDKLDSERFIAHDLHPLSPADFKAAEAEVCFQHLDRTVQLTEEDQGLTLMQIADRHGVPIETGCRQGMCGTCKLTLRQGEVTGNVLANSVYLCTSFPASNRVVLDA
jgi:ferredoxin-NADP reductase